MAGSGIKSRRLGRSDAKVEVARIQWRGAFWQGVWRAIAVIVPSALKYGCITWGLTKAAQVLVAWTGQDTQARVNLSLLVDFLGHRATGFLAPWLAVWVMWMLYRREQRQKREAIARLGEVNRKYESLIDPGRTSSHLATSANSRRSDLP